MRDENRARARNLERLLNPRHIAFIGGDDAAVAIGEARRIGYSGEMWAVNPRRQTLNGLPCFASVSDLPQAPDGVFMAIPARHAVDSVRELSAIGAGGVTCYTAGFGETGGDGLAREAALVDALGDMVMVGPNCYGLINYLDRAALWPFTHGGACPGYGAAIITQSGMLSSDMTMSQRSLPLAYMISTGNQADLGVADFIDVLCEKPHVRAFGLHIEGLSDIAAFERAALKALRNGKPIVALKTGKSIIGETLTMSHTGSLSGSNELYDALFRRCGVIRVANPTQMLETLKFLCVAGAPKGNRLIGFTCSGAGATMIADHAETVGIDLPAFGSAASQTIEALLPDVAHVSNPLDYSTPIWGQPDKTGPVFREAVDQAGADAALLIQDYPAPDLDEMLPFYVADANVFADAAAGLPAAICSTLPENMDAQTRDRLVARGIAPLQGLHEGMNAIADAMAWTRDHKRIIAAPPAPLMTPEPAGTRCMIDEAEAKVRLFKFGFPVPESRTVCGEAASAVACEIGFPVALKMMGKDIAHKTEVGAVMLGLDSPEAVSEAVTDMSARVALRKPDAVSDRFLVESVAPAPIAELVVGLRHDPQFGLAMTIGSGGVLVDMLDDHVTLLLPTHPDEIARALSSLRAAKLLEGYRGRARVDMDMLVESLLQLTCFAHENAGRIAEIEINPLFVYESSVLVVDALMFDCADARQ